MFKKKKIIILLFVLIIISITFLVINNIFKTPVIKNNNGVGELGDGSILKDWVLDKELEIILDKAEAIQSIKYDINTDDQRKGNFTMRFWEKEGKIRAENINRWQTNTYYINMEDEEYYFHSSGDRNAVVLLEREVSDILEESVLRKMIFVFNNNQPIIINKEKIEEKDCVVVKYIVEEGKDAKMWIWEKHGLPVKIEEDTVKKEIINIEFKEIEDSYLELPADINKVDYFTY